MQFSFGEPCSSPSYLQQEPGNDTDTHPGQ